MTIDAAYEIVLVAGAALCTLRAVRVPRERLAWSLVSAALVLWVAADLYSLIVEPQAYPSLADAGWLLFYPLCYVAIWLIVRSRLRTGAPGLWLDGILGGLTVAAVAASLLFQPIVDAGTGSAAAVTVNLAYPIADLGLLVFVVGAIGLTGWRPDRGLLLLAIGLAVGAVADSWYLYLVAIDAYQGVAAAAVDGLWPVSMILIALAAWQPVPPRRLAVRVTGWRALVLPSVFLTIALAIELRDHFVRVSNLSIVLATAALLTGIVRLALAFRDNERMLAHSQHEATTDALTHLRNRRALMIDLDEQVERARTGAPRLLALFDLDGFKSYNDSFGHAAGDELLARLGRRLADAVDDLGTAYRLGGDEFCVLARVDETGPGPLLATAAAALREGGEGFAVASSYGAVLVPAEAHDANAALLLADRRMYAAKHGGRDPAGRQTRDVLVTTLRESEPELADHVDGVAKYALAVARELGMPADECHEVARAAELHDIGKIAIPDAILGKSAALDQAEWDFMRRHTVIGERILAAAPAMRGVAKLVRSSHERWDGQGYPDKLAGEAIPLGARIVSVCDAYEAMVSDRPYRTGMPPADALAELRRCAGTQFDPRVVDAFALLPEWARDAPEAAAALRRA